MYFIEISLLRFSDIYAESGEDVLRLEIFFVVCVLCGSQVTSTHLLGVDSGESHTINGQPQTNYERYIRILLLAAAATYHTIY